MIFGFGNKTVKPAGKTKLVLPIFLTNTLSREKEQFIPPHMRFVKMYNCGPTVYDVQHIGNLSAFVFANLLRRMLEYNGLDVKQVINITDVGHLTGDNEGNPDEGEDKMRRALKREGMEATLENMEKIALKFTKIFIDDISRLSIDTKKIEFPHASKYVDSQIAFIQTLDDKGYSYVIKDGVYFDTSLFADYGKLGNIDTSKQKSSARVPSNPEKKNPADFALWKFNKKLGWDSPWGKGFPGWHIECSAMIRSTLGEQIDIHTGGIEHIGVHHNNEIAQSEAATRMKPLSRYWMHRSHIQLDGQKMAKSEGRVVYLSDIIEKGFHPLAFRYWLLGGHYRTPMNFTWEAMEGAQTAFLRLHNIRQSLKDVEEGAVDKTWQKQFHERINDDLDTAGALALLWDMTKDKTLEPSSFLATLLDFDKVLGIGLNDPDKEIIKMLKKEFGSGLEKKDLPENIQNLLKEREVARNNKDWKKADKIRENIQSQGFIINDISTDTFIYRK
jgi:cysteinyl-tRNA synthetase